MNSLNPMFRQKKKQVATNTPEDKIVRKLKSPTARKVTDIKFPITEQEWEGFCRMAISMGLGDRQTFANTKFMQKALNDPAIIEGTYGQDYVREELGGVYYRAEPGIHIDYKDTKRYLHVKPNVSEHEKIQELKFKWGLRSKRQVVHRVMIAALRRSSWWLDVKIISQVD